MSANRTVSGLAARAGISPHPVRDYGRLGLLSQPPVPRPASAATTRTRWRGCGSSRAPSGWACVEENLFYDLVTFMRQIGLGG
jgi:hypothetical protein